MRDGIVWMAPGNEAVWVFSTPPLRPAGILGALDTLDPALTGLAA
jgi:hypothetical protein